MADFIINIEDDPVVPVQYTSHTGMVSSYTNCFPATLQSTPVRVLTVVNTNYGFMETYTGEQWKYLTIQNIALPDCCMAVKYGAGYITNADLPLKIDIEALSAENLIPGLFIEADDYHFVDALDTKAVNFTYEIEDIHGTKGGSKIASAQIRVRACPTPTYSTPNIVSPLSDSIGDENDNNLIWEYYIVADGPVTSYGTLGLPLNISVMNPKTGYIRIDCSSLQDRLETTVIQFDISATHDQAVPTTDTETFTLTILPWAAQYY